MTIKNFILGLLIAIFAGIILLVFGSIYAPFGKKITEVTNPFQEDVRIDDSDNMDVCKMTSFQKFDVIFLFPFCPFEVKKANKDDDDIVVTLNAPIDSISQEITIKMYDKSGAEGEIFKQKIGDVVSFNFRKITLLRLLPNRSTNSTNKYFLAIKVDENEPRMTPVHMSTVRN